MNELAKKAKQWATKETRKAKSAQVKAPRPVPPDKVNGALAETALNRMGYPQGPKPKEISPAVQAIANSGLDTMNCPLISNPDWDCNQVREGEELGHPVFNKGEESQCKNGGFVNCPAYRRYFNWRLGYAAKKRGGRELEK